MCDRHSPNFSLKSYIDVHMLRNRPLIVPRVEESLYGWSPAY